MRRQRGFTLVELMMVVTIIAIVGGLAVTSFRKSNTRVGIDAFAQMVHTAVIQANRRALTTRAPYMLDLRTGSVSWCRVDPITITAGPPAVTTQVTCPPPTATVERSRPQSVDDAILSFWANAADVRGATGSYVAASKTPIGGGARIYFGPNGTADETFDNVMNTGLPLTGNTIYVRRRIADEPEKRKRIVIFGPSSRPRVIDGY